MKKYFLKKNGQELKIGDKVQLTKSVNTSYGEGKVITEVAIDSEEILDRLVNDGFVGVEQAEPEHEEGAEALLARLKPYIRRIGRKNDLDYPTTCAMLNAVLHVSPKAHLQMLIESIAEVKNRDKHAGKSVYYLNPISSFKPVEIIGNPNSATVFFDAADALEAHSLLLPFIKDLMLNGK